MENESYMKENVLIKKINENLLRNYVDPAKYLERNTCAIGFQTKINIPTGNA